MRKVRSCPPSSRPTTWPKSSGLASRPTARRSCKGTPREVLRLSFAGPEGEDHAGLTRPSDSRVSRAVSARHRDPERSAAVDPVGGKNIAAIAAKMGLPGLPPAVFGATMVVRGIPEFHAHPALLAPAGRGKRRDPDRGHGKPALSPLSRARSRPRMPVSARPSRRRLPGGGASRRGWNERARSRWVHACACISPISRPGPMPRRRGSRHPRQR